jgi:hypothetical protein
MYLCRPKRGKPNEIEAGSWSEKRENRLNRDKGSGQIAKS